MHDPALPTRRRPAHTRVAALALLASSAPLLTACAATPPRHDWTTLAPGLRLDPDARAVEFDATVAMDCHNPTTPDVYLELIACSPDTREHEALVVTDIPPSLIHAALLAAGLEHGAPGELATGSPPSGDRVTVELIAGRASTATDWITDAPTRTRTPPHDFVFAGSRLATRTTGGETREVYDADGTGVIIGLTTFGSELIAHVPLISPDASTDEPVWIADPRVVPDIGTPVRVRITATNRSD